MNSVESSGGEPRHGNRPPAPEEGDGLDVEALDVESIVAELEAAREQAASHLDDLKRVAADFENYRKRVAKESASNLDRAAERVVVGLIPALDSFDAALRFEPTGEQDRQLYAGMLNTREQLLKALGAEGLEVIPTIGERFDPGVHEPVAAADGEGDLVVTSELRRGYRIGDKVLRPALVALDLE
jgi:molecular chaperone GrpE